MYTSSKLQKLYFCNSLMLSGYVQLYFVSTSSYVIYKCSESKKAKKAKKFYTENNTTAFQYIQLPRTTKYKNSEIQS